MAVQTRSQTIKSFEEEIKVINFSRIPTFVPIFFKFKRLQTISMLFLLSKEYQLEILIFSLIRISLRNLFLRPKGLELSFGT
jgi:hypothetical protein